MGFLLYMGNMEQKTAFEKRILRIVSGIPEGTVLTYKQVAQKAGFPNAYRAVGTVMRKNTDYEHIPCHRVIRSDGTAGKYNKGDAKKKTILEKEGIRFSRHGICRIPSNAIRCEI